MSPRSGRIALVIALAAIAIFITSFILGLRGRDTGAGPDTTLQHLPVTERVRIEVLNAAGKSGLAREATIYLRDRGHDVVYFGNADEFGLDSSLVLDRTGKLDNARAVAEALGVERVRTEPDSTLLLEVTVLLGKDWSSAR